MLQKFVVTVAALWIAMLPARADVVIGVADDVHADYLRFLQQHETDTEHQPETVLDFQRPAARRDVVELVLVIQALKLGKTPGDEFGLYKIVSMPNYGRLMQELAGGRLSVTGGGIWRHDTKGNPALDASPALIPEGEFLAGMYTRPDHKGLTATKPTLETLKSMSVVSNRL